MFIALGTLSACAALVAWSIPDLDLATNPDGSAATAVSGGRKSCDDDGLIERP
jgi:hypothetical protein